MIYADIFTAFADLLARHPATPVILAALFIIRLLVVRVLRSLFSQ